MIDPALTEAVRRVYVRPVDPSRARADVAVIAEAARTADSHRAPGAAPSPRRARRRRAPVWRPALAAAAAVLALPGGLAVAGVDVPEPFDAPYRAVGIELPHQQARGGDERRPAPQQDTRTSRPAPAATPPRTVPATPPPAASPPASAAPATPKPKRAKAKARKAPRRALPATPATPPTATTPAVPATPATPAAPRRTPPRRDRAAGRRPDIAPRESGRRGGTPGPRQGGGTAERAPRNGRGGTAERAPRSDRGGPSERGAQRGRGGAAERGAEDGAGGLNQGRGQGADGGR